MEIVGRVCAWRLAALLARISTRQSPSALQKVSWEFLEALCILGKPHFPIIPPLAICAPSSFVLDVLLGSGSADMAAWLRVRSSIIDFLYWRLDSAQDDILSDI